MVTYPYGSTHVEGSTSPLLSDDVRYPYFLRVCSSDVNQGVPSLNEPNIQVLLGWRQRLSTSGLVLPL